MLAFGIVAALLAFAIMGVSVLLIGLVLLQKNKGAGLSGAFGGVGGHSAFGTKTGDVMTWLTVGLTAMFLILNIAGTFVFDTSKPRTAPVVEALPETNGETSADGASSALIEDSGAAAPEGAETGSDAAATPPAP